MQHVTETASGQQNPTKASDAWHVNSVMFFQGNLEKFQTETKLSNPSAKLFAGEISQCSGLTELKISGNDPGFVQSFASGLGKCPTLKRLDLSANNIGDADIASLLLVIKNCPKLVSLTLLDNQLGPEALKTLQKGLKDTERGQSLQLKLHRT